MGADTKLVPVVRVFLNGQPLPPALEDTLQTVDVDLSLNVIDMAVLEFENPRGKTADLPQLEYGVELEVQLGYVGDLVKVFLGQIVSLEPVFPHSGNPSVRVRAYDKQHTARHGGKQRQWNDVKVADVVRELAGEEGWRADVEDTGVRLPYLAQNNLTNMQLIRELGRRWGFEARVDKEGTLRFNKPSSDQPPAVTLKWMENLKSFYVRKSTANVPTRVESRFWDAKQPTHRVQEHGGLHARLGADVVAETEQAFGQGTFQITANPDQEPGEAQAVAWARYNEAALEALVGKGTAIGDPALEPGQVLELEGLGEAWNGSYYVTAVTHLWSSQEGSAYTTEFRVRRTGNV